MERTSEKSNLMRPGLIITALVVITVTTYSAVGTFGFVNFDDPQYVQENAQVIKGLTWSGLQWAFTSGHAANWHPLTWLSHMLDVQLFGMQPGPHHLVNLLLHVINTLLLFGFLHRTTGAAGRSALVAALFAVHPLHVESVAWISERKDVLSTLFFMLTLWAYAAYANKRTVARYLAVFVLLGLGLMAKPMLVTLPFLLLLLDVWPLKRFSLADWDGKAALRLAVEKLPLLLLVVASSVITFLVQREGGAVSDLTMTPLGMRLSNATLSYVTYVRNMLWPSGLAVLYPFPATIPLWKTTAALTLLSVLTLSALMAVRRFPYVTVGWFWYVGTLVPVIGIVQVGSQALADRYTYIPLIGLFVIIAWGGFELLDRGPRWRVPQLALGLVSVAVLAVLSWVQIGYWENAKVLWARTLAVTTRNYMAHTNYGKLLTEEGLKSEALKHFKEAVRIQPVFNEAYTLVGNALFELGRPDEALPYHEKSLRLKSDFAPAHSGMGNTLTALGRADEAIPHFQRALELTPDSPITLNGLGSALDELGRVDEAVDYYRKALELDPEFAAAHNNLAAAFVRQGRIEEAVGAMQAALEIDPDNPEYHYNYALLINHQGNTNLAISHLERALELDPGNQGVSQTLNNLRSNRPEEGQLP